MRTNNGKQTNMRTRYTVCMRVGEHDHVLACSTYKEIADKINSQLGYNIVSKTIVTNWLSRGRKSAKYDFITIT